MEFETDLKPQDIQKYLKSVLLCMLFCTFGGFMTATLIFFIIPMQNLIAFLAWVFPMMAISYLSSKKIFAMNVINEILLPYHDYYEEKNMLAEK